MINTLAELYKVGKTKAEKDLYFLEIIRNLKVNGLDDEQKSNLVIAVINSLEEFKGDVEYNEHLEEYLRKHEDAILEGVDLKSSLILC